MSSKCTLRRSMRTGVPVFMRALRMPWRVMLSVRCSAAGSAMRPPFTMRRPMCIRPLRKVPAVSTTQGAWNSAPQMVRTPVTVAAGGIGAAAAAWAAAFSWAAVFSAPVAVVWYTALLAQFTGLVVRSSSTWSCQMSRLAVSSSTLRHCQMNFPRSHCARGLHMAGPLLRLSMRNCMAVASVTRPICPPRASISRTICPLAMPPTAGLHDIWAILFMSIVMSSVRAPMLALAVAASQPACPPPMTITS